MKNEIADVRFLKRKASVARILCQLNTLLTTLHYTIKTSKTRTKKTPSSRMVLNIQEEQLFTSGSSLFTQLSKTIAHNKLFRSVRPRIESFSRLHSFFTCIYHIHKQWTRCILRITKSVVQYI